MAHLLVYRNTKLMSFFLGKGRKNEVSTVLESFVPSMRLPSSFLVILVGDSPGRHVWALLYGRIKVRVQYCR